MEKITFWDKVSDFIDNMGVWFVISLLVIVAILIFNPFQYLKKKK